MEKREFFYIAPSISIVDMHFESAVLQGSNANGSFTISDLGDDEDVTLN